MSDGAAFSLVEVLVATVVLALAVVSTTTVALTAQANAARATRHDSTAAVVRDQLAILRGLPFSPAVDLGTVTAVVEPPTVVGVAFPHADEARNTARSAYHAEPWQGGPGGCFVTTSTLAGGRLTIVAQFAVEKDGQWVPLPADAVAHWVAGSQPPPAAAVIVDLCFEIEEMSYDAVAVLAQAQADDRTDES